MMKLVKSIAIVLVLFFGLSLFVLSNQVGGFRSFIVQSASMEPAIMTGSMVVTQYAHPSTLKKDDVITFIRPTEERDFITHRVTDIRNSNGYIGIKTKGDNNNNEDNWEVPGGSVVGKVNTSIPYLGYILGFAQGKLGILLFIILPAVYLIVEEVANIVNLFRKKKNPKLETTEATVLVMALLFTTSVLSVQPTQALLSDKVILQDNQFTVILPTPTLTPIPTKKPCGGNTTVVISGNGVGSNNNVNVSNNCTTVIKQANNITVTNNVNSSSNTGNNTSSFNTSSSSITTSNAVSQVSSTTVLGTNTVNTGNTTLTTSQSNVDPENSLQPEPTIVQEPTPEASVSGTVE